MKHEFTASAGILNREGKMDGDKEKKATHTHQHLKVPELPQTVREQARCGGIRL